MTFDQTLDLIRDEIGETPDDDTLEEYHTTLGHWILVCIRVLKRRYAAAVGGGQETTSFTLDGVLSVGMSKADLNQLQKQINRLEARYKAETTGHPVGMSRIVRSDR